MFLRPFKKFCIFLLGGSSQKGRKEKRNRSKETQRADWRCRYEKMCWEVLKSVEKVFSYSYDLYLDFGQLHTYE